VHLTHYQRFLLIIYSYHIANANEYLVVTGAGIDDLHICKKAYVWPWQKVRNSGHVAIDRYMLSDG
jgi:hypothetical protein